MLSKPINLVLVYIVTTFNLAILASPLLVLVLPFVEFHNHSLTIEQDILWKIRIIPFFLLFITSFLMLVYLMLDFLFGFSSRAALKGCARYEKIKDYDFLSEIFSQIKNKFDDKGVNLYIKNSDEINAFAVGSIGSKSIVLTRGLIDHYLVTCKDPKDFLYSIRSIIGHEMSHLINKDFLPTFLIITNQKVTNFISKILHIFFKFIVRIIVNLPYGGRSAGATLWKGYLVMNFFVNLFNRFAVYNIYEFLRRFISRSVEYRCDNQSAKAFGGKNMVLALSHLGKDSYFTLFSTHPRNSARIKKVKDVSISDQVIKPRIIDSVSNCFSLMFLVAVCIYFAKESGVDLMVLDAIRNHEALYRKLSMLWNLLKKIY